MLLSFYAAAVAVADMDALLNLDSPRSNFVCSSVQDIQDRLHHTLTSKSSDTRAEHTSLTFEFRHNTVFHLSADADNTNPDGSVNPTNQPQQQSVVRSVNVSETVQSQPADDPVLQQAVARHIVGAMGVIDSSTWAVRQVSRGAQGWTFTYICKDSLQAWNRANGKNAEKSTIASYSGPGSLDPTQACKNIIYCDCYTNGYSNFITARPAFDCRGTLTIAFSKISRSIIVKYNHTPIHKSVQELLTLLAPSIPPAPLNKGNANNQRTPKVRRPPPTEGEEGNSRRKRIRKMGKAPEAPMGDLQVASGQVEQKNVEPQTTVQNDVQYTSLINIPPDEAARRRQAAIVLLKREGINPGTLSEEQFEIFSNQSPELQASSLEMLVTYGAARLRIVHPIEEELHNPSTSPSAEEQPPHLTPATHEEPMTTHVTAETPAKRRGRKRQSGGPAVEIKPVVSVEENGEVGTTASTLKPSARKTRGACQTCKDAKLKVRIYPIYGKRNQY